MASIEGEAVQYPIYTQGSTMLLEASVYGLAFHPDASLAASCGLDVLARVWDLRPGKSVLALEGHGEQQQEQNEKEVNPLVKLDNAKRRQLVHSVITFVLIATFVCLVKSSSMQQQE
ncbi:U4/U6 small nuclear ribonucleoprotein PRP4-like protein [Tanacetum coccineum]